MAVYENREAYIPYTRQDLIQLCIEDGLLTSEDFKKFRNFCQLLAAYYHFKFHHILEDFKENFAPFNPDADTKPRIKPNLIQKEQMKATVVDSFKKLVEKANYNPLSQASLQRAFEEKSLINLKTEIDFNEFELMLCYCRGDIYQTIYVKKLFKRVEKTIDVFARVALLIKFKANSKFISQKRENLQFQSEKIYVYIYKNIPKKDIEFIFPNVKISMTWKDRLLFGVPAIGAAIPMVLQVLPRLLLILGIIAFVIFGVRLEGVKLTQEDLKNLMPILITMFSVIVTLGGFAFKQYSNYQNKLLKFQKNVSDTLFFQKVASHQGVFQALLDAAEEEECKEIILVYYHLLTSNMLLTPEQLDDKIEEWMANKFDTKIDFDIQATINNLEEITAKIGEKEKQLLTTDSQGYCQVLPLDEALTVIDYLWDNAFMYNSDLR